MPVGVAVQLSYATLNDLVVDRGQLTEARRIFALLAEAGPESADLFNNYGLLCRDTGAYAESYEAYCRSVELNDTDPEECYRQMLSYDHIYCRRQERWRPTLKLSILFP